MPRFLGKGGGGAPGLAAGVKWGNKTTDDKTKVRRREERPPSSGWSCGGELDDNLSLDVFPLDGAGSAPPSSASQVL